MANRLPPFGSILLLIAAGISIASTRYLPTIATIPFSVNGARVTFSNIAIGSDATLRCIGNFSDGSILEDEPIVTYDRKHATCRLPPNIGSGKVRVDLEVTDGATGRTASEGAKVFSRDVILTSAPSLDLKVVEDWNAFTVEFTWNVDFFKKLYPEDHRIYLEATIEVSEGGKNNFVPTSINLAVGFNQEPTKKAVSISTANQEVISGFRSPYYYVLRSIQHPKTVFVTSEIFTPTLGATEATAKLTCSNWLNNNRANPQQDEVAPCPNCYCKAQNDPNFAPTAYDPKIVELAGDKLKDHQLFYQKVPSASGYAQTCSYNVPTDALATSAPAAGFLHFVSKDISYTDNYLSDIWPYIVCCLQANADNYCEAFHSKRPIDTGHNYPGKDDPCHGHGDPHLVTFDGLKYEFMGYGEFWLIYGPGSENGTFGVQGRMAPIKEGQKVTYYTGFAIRDGNTTVQIEHVDGRLQIIIDRSYLLDMSKTPLKISLVDVSISVTGAIVEVGLATGFTIRVRSIKSNHFNFIGTGAIRNKGKGYMGIFGTFDGNRENDFTNREERMIPATSDMSKIYNVFGLSWMITANESFFRYGQGQSHASHAHPSFLPLLEYPDPATMPEEVRAICKENLACYYEYVGTGNLEDAKSTMEEDEKFDKMKEENGKKILTCTQLSSPPAGKVDVEGYLSGSTAKYSCRKGANMAGDTERKCKEVDGKAVWTGKEPICTWTCAICPKDVEYLLSHDPSDCSGLVLCANGNRIPLHCPDGENFNPETRSCEENYLCVNPPAC